MRKSPGAAPLQHHGAAIDRDRLSGDKAAGVGEEIEHRADEVGRHQVALDRLVRPDGLQGPLDAGAEDVVREDDRFLVSTSPGDFHAVQETLKGKGVHIAEAELAMVPKTTVQVSGKEGDSLLKLLETLEELDDVQKVWANFDMDVSEMARAE